MGFARVCVIDSSPTVRETIAIVLGAEHSVLCLTPEDYLHEPANLTDADLLILGENALPAEGIASLPGSLPILWLHEEGNPLRAASGRTGVIPRSFDPENLRSNVHALLSQPLRAQPTLHSWSVLEFPLLPQDVVDLARHAIATRFPTLICGEPGTGKARLARAIHSATGIGRFVSVSADSCTRETLVQAGSIDSGDLTVFVSDVASAPPAAQELLLELLDCGGFTSNRGWHDVRLICGSVQTLHQLARSSKLDRDLYYRLSVLPILLPPLRERTEDIPAVAHHIAAGLTRLLSAQPVTFTKRATERLTHYLWFGNLTELETVLTRTIALTESRTIDAEDLLFGYGRLVPRRADTPKARAGPVPHGPNGTVDLIINELAHEFKNPMVTIKTVAQHLERLLADQAGREEVARLTGEAVDRMDRALENLLQFTRFKAPNLQDVPLNALLAPCLSDLAPQLSERRVSLDYHPAPARGVFVDAAQIVYAFENLLRVIARDLQTGQTLSIRPLECGTGLMLEYTGTAQTTAGKLAGFLDRVHDGDDATLPLGLVFAKTLIERNGGRMEIRSAADSTGVTVWLPSREELATGNGKTTRLSS